MTRRRLISKLKTMQRASRPSRLDSTQTALVQKLGAGQSLLSAALCGMGGIDGFNDPNFGLGRLACSTARAPGFGRCVVHLSVLAP